MVRKEALDLLKEGAENQLFDLFFGDATKVSETGYVPYGWQFDDEEVCIESQRGSAINCFGLLSKKNDFHYKTTTNNINADFVLTFLDDFSYTLKQQTVVVLDNASVNTANKIKRQMPYWQARGLYIFYLPPYSPHLNIIERLWKELKARWLRPQDYISQGDLFYAVQLALATVGKDLFINFS